MDVAGFRALMLTEPERKKPTLAVVSTRDDLCGIAGYTRALIIQLAPYYDIEVFDLDQFIMHSINRRLRKIADQQILEFSKRLKTFDHVNIQLEFGTLGIWPRDIVRRFSKLARSAKHLSVTFHTVLTSDPFPSQQVLKQLGRFRIDLVIYLIANHFSLTRAARKINDILLGLQKQIPVHVIVHSKRDFRLMQLVNKIENVYAHPLAFFHPDECKKIRARTTRSDFPIAELLPSDAYCIGVFGFLSPYKGFDTVVNAMHLLPGNCHLLMFGGVHPNEIKKWMPVDPFVKRLISGTYANTNLLDYLDEAPKGSANITLSLDAASEPLLRRHPRDISDRVHFMGSQTDEGFAKSMAICDVVVLPYLETGQSGSGVLSIAVEMGCRVIASRSKPFMQFEKFNPGTVEFFDIGNFLELKDRILARPEHPVGMRHLPHSTLTNIKIYRQAHGGV